MRGDFSRLTYEPANGFTQVLFQQGQDLVESEFNEQASLLRHQIRTVGRLTEQLVRRQPKVPTYKVDPQVGTGTAAGQTVPLIVKLSGEVYVPGDGMVPLGEGEHGRTAKQYTLPAVAVGSTQILYLDTYEETVNPEALPGAIVADPALAPRDGALRLRRVSRLDVVSKGEGAPPQTDDDFRTLLGPKRRPGDGKLRPVPKAAGARAPAADPQCAPLAGAGDQDVENQLYRVEIHEARPDGDGDKVLVKWSRDNAAVAYPFTGLDRAGPAGTAKLQLTIPGGAWTDDRWKLTNGDMVELVDMSSRGPGPAGGLEPPAVPLLRVERADAVMNAIVVTLTDPAGGDPAAVFLKEPRPNLLIRWDHHFEAGSEKGCVTLTLDNRKRDGTVPLDDGLSVRLSEERLGQFRTGDYWLIPARVAIGDVLWRRDGDDANAPYEARTPRGPRHVYVPLAVLKVADAQHATADPYPWDAGDAAAGATHPPVVAGVPAAGKDLAAKVPAERKSAQELADMFKDVRQPVGNVFSVRQLLVVALKSGVSPLDPPPQPFTELQLLEAARRLSFDPMGLVKRIAEEVRGLLTKPVGEGLKERLKADPIEKAKTPEALLSMLQPTDLSGGAADVKEKIQAVEQYKSLAGLAAAGSVAQVRANVPNTTDDQLQPVWQAARRVKFYLDAWPFERVLDTDVPNPPQPQPG